jgi:hypothetical protein
MSAASPIAVIDQGIGQASVIHLTCAALSRGTLTPIPELAHHRLASSQPRNIWPKLALTWSPDGHQRSKLKAKILHQMDKHNNFNGISGGGRSLRRTGLSRSSLETGK